MKYLPQNVTAEVLAEVGQRVVKYTAGLYGAGVVELWDLEQVRALASRLGAEPVCLELDTHAVPLGQFHHPTDVLYIVGPELGTIPREVLDLGRVVKVETASPFPLKPSVAAAIVLHDHYLQQIGVPA